MAVAETVAEISEDIISSSPNGKRVIIPVTIAIGIVAVAGAVALIRRRKNKVDEVDLWTEATEETKTPAA